LANLRPTLLLTAAALAVVLGGCAGLSGERATAEHTSSGGAAADMPDWLTVRGQSPSYPGTYPSDTLPGGYSRGPQPVSGGVPPIAGAYAPPVAYGSATPQPSYVLQPPAPATGLPPPPIGATPGVSPVMPGYPDFQPPSNLEIPATPTPLDVLVEETRTGQLMFGVTVNSNAGLIGNIVINERNFDITNWPSSWDDFATGRAFRGAGQGFRIEAQPGTVLQRYLVSFTEPYFLSTNVSFDASGYYYNRVYFDWTEARVGGRLGLGRRLTPDLSLAGSLRAEDVDVFGLRVRGIPELEAVRGHNDIFSGRVTLAHDTRDIPFAPTQGHLVSLSFEQAFGEFSFPRGDVEYAQYFLVRQRPDGSGRHTAAYLTKLGVSGSGTPIFENYFAGGFSTLRGYQFRGASPRELGVTIGGRFQWLNSVEYYFPLTADDMIRGTFFVDFGTVERNVALHHDQFRVAPGFGFRINIPAMGPAPLAFDFAFPVASADTDQRQVFSFFFGASR
jgi:outer membrane protein insertion porin family